MFGWVRRDILEAERSASERLLAHHQRENERLAALVEALRRELSAVTARAMERPALPGVPDPAPKPEASKLAQAIREEAAGDPQLAAHYWKLAGQLRRAQKSDDEIIEEVRRWVTVGDPLDALLSVSGGM